MSKISNIKEKKGYLNKGIIDILSKLDISGRNKYLPLLVRIFENGLKKYIHNVNDDNDIEFAYAQEILCNNNFKFEDDNEKYVTLMIVTAMSNDLGISIEDLWLFMGFMERGIINNKNLDDYNTIYDIIRANSEGECKINSKSDITDDECYKLYEDDQFLAVLPLTIRTSLKYGAGTKWCTSSKENPNTFDKYYKGGLLIYVIDKEFGNKLAINTENGYEVYYWDVLDQKLYETPPWFSGKLQRIVISFISRNLGLSNYDLNPDGTIKEENIKGYRSQILDLAKRNRINTNHSDRRSDSYPVSYRVDTDRIRDQLKITYSPDVFDRLLKYQVSTTSENNNPED